MTKPLSPAALATWNAFLEHSEWEVTPVELNGVAAALRAAADQVVPEFAHDDDDIYSETIQDVRHKLLAIAAELEGGND
jgi:hypothetical protein